MDENVRRVYAAAPVPVQGGVVYAQPQPQYVNAYPGQTAYVVQRPANAYYGAAPVQQKIVYAAGPPPAAMQDMRRREMMRQDAEDAAMCGMVTGCCAALACCSMFAN